MKTSTQRSCTHKHAAKLHTARSTAARSQKQRFTASLEGDYIAALRITAEQQNTSVANVIRNAVCTYVEGL